MDKIREALNAYANEYNWAEDENGILRIWVEPDSTTSTAYDGFNLAKAALSSPHPEAREEDIDNIKAIIRGHVEGPNREIALVALSRLASQKYERQIIPQVLVDMMLCNAGVDNYKEYRWKMGVVCELYGFRVDPPTLEPPAAPEPRPAEEPSGDVVLPVKTIGKLTGTLHFEPAPATPSEEPWAITKLRLEVEARKSECKTVTRERDALRSQLARKDEGMRQALDKAGNILCGLGHDRSWIDAALREPDGRKGE